MTKNNRKKNSKKRSEGRISKRSLVVSGSGRSSKGRKKGRIHDLSRYMSRGNLIILLVVVSALVLVVNWVDITNSLSAIQIEPTINNSKFIRKPIDNVDLVTESTLIVLTTSTGMDLRIEHAFVVVQNKEKAKQWIVHIPGNIYISSSFSNFADYTPVSNLYYLGELEEKGAGKEYTIWELGQLLGYKFNNYIWLDDQAVSTMFGELKDYNDSFSILTRMIGSASPINLLINNHEIVKIANGTDSNMRIDRIVALMGSIRAVQDDPEEYFDFELSELQELRTSEFGIEIPVVTYASVDDRLKNIGDAVLDKDVEREQAKIEVYNGSEISGLASRYTRKLSNNGMNVIRINNTDDLYEKSVIYTSDAERFGHTISAIRQLMPVDVIVEPERPSFLTTGDIVLVLGMDLNIDSSWLVNDSE